MSGEKITTIKISKKTAEELANIKIHPRQSYEEVILKLIKECGKNIKEVKK